MVIGVFVQHPPPGGLSDGRSTLRVQAPEMFDDALPGSGDEDIHRRHGCSKRPPPTPSGSTSRSRASP